MLTKQNLREYQLIALDFILNKKRCGLFLDMGLGKTATTLTAIDILKYDRLEVNKVLVIAPKTVAEDTWSKEIEKWEHLKHLKSVKLLGSKKQREAALREDADIYLINKENIVWLVRELSTLGDGWFFDMVIIDELSSFKNPSAQRVKILKKLYDCNSNFKNSRFVGLTGTPSPKGLVDLWSQVYLIDGGERLGKYITHYRQNYCQPDKKNWSNGRVYSYKVHEEGEKKIHKKLEDIVISMENKDWLNLPERVDNIIRVILPSKTKKEYMKFEKELVLELCSGEITAQTKSVLMNKLLQFCNGAVYSDNKEYLEIYDKKLEALKEIIENSNGKPVLVFYNFNHDVERIKKMFSDVETIKGTESISRWNRKEIPILLAHPASAGHGLNLQSGGNIIVWFGLTWNLENYLQANARLHRQGQTESVIIHHLITEGTIEERVLKSLQEKKKVQDDLIEHLKKKYIKENNNV